VTMRKCLNDEVLFAKMCVCVCVCFFPHFDTTHIARAEFLYVGITVSLTSSRQSRRCLLVYLLHKSLPVLP
jgi:hypothetical protein